MVALLTVVAAVAALGVAGYLVWPRERPDEEDVCRARCPRCDQKVRYGAARASRQVMCPRCRRRWILPATPQPLPALPRASALLRRRSA